jgi:hypothetical protein
MEFKRLMMLALLAAAATAAAARVPALRADDKASPASLASRGSFLRRHLLSVNIRSKPGAMPLGVGAPPELPCLPPRVPTTCTHMSLGQVKD